MSDVRLGGKYLCSECGEVHGTALSSCKADYPNILEVKDAAPATKSITMPEKLTITPTKSREQRLLDGEDFLAMPCVVGHVDGMKHKHYTLTTAAEENTRKVVRDVLEKVVEIMNPEVQECTFVEVDFIREIVDNLLTQYQDQQPQKEDNNE